MGGRREEIVKRLKKKTDEGLPVIGGGAGTGISAKFEEAGGIDLIVIYNSGRFRMSGHGSMAGLLPFGSGHVVDVVGGLRRQFHTLLDAVQSGSQHGFLDINKLLGLCQHVNRAVIVTQYIVRTGLQCGLHHLVFINPGCKTEYAGIRKLVGHRTIRTKVTARL